MSSVIARLRLISGLLLLAFVASHLSAHASLITSLQTAQQMLRTIMHFWQMPLPLYLLWTAAIVHVAINVWTLINRQTFRLAGWHLAQNILGLLIPLLLIPHFVYNRVMFEIEGTGTDYAWLLAVYFWHDPWTGVLQLTLLLTVWIHGAIGVWHWLKVRPWFRRIRDPLLAVAVMIPALSVAGIVSGGLETVDLIEDDPAYLEQLDRRWKWTPERHDIAEDLVIVVEAVVLGGYLLIGASIGIRQYRARKNRAGVLRYGDRQKLSLLPGATLLETLQEHHVPHASLCGGRARCTTCRVLVRDGLGQLTPPGTAESAALKRISAPETVRLACQIKPQADISVVPLLPPSATMRDVAARPPLVGHERDVTVMFVDLRGSTTIGEANLPYDVLFILNRFFSEIVAVLDETEGHYANFTGDGLMALYGLNTAPAEAAESSIRAAGLMLARLDGLNAALASEAVEALGIGIGIHSGLAIVGEMGPPATPLVSAIGDTVNTAARLEALSKSLGAPVVISEETRQRAGFEATPVISDEVAPRGRAQKLAVHGYDGRAFGSAKPATSA